MNLTLKYNEFETIKKWYEKKKKQYEVHDSIIGLTSGDRQTIGMQGRFSSFFAASFFFFFLVTNSYFV